MKNLKMFGEPGCYGASYRDDGTHNGEKLEVCPWCRRGDALEVYNTHTALYAVRCTTCGVEKDGEVEESAEWAKSEEELVAAHMKAFKSAVLGWNAWVR